ncbi:unnamed protein product [Phytomonas sp. Hart1]|nr:unnamed protein product [Phytomonas sp. Hart1]|eukprot:CCW69299.1 unnamed protein product [Phytomonas sp. isolate Hart1]
MASYAELLQISTDFQKNFSVLNGKHNVVLQELHDERARSTALQAKLDAGLCEVEKLQAELHRLREELEAAAAYKARYTAATVSLEHLKGHLENARRGVAELLLRHDQEVEQLQAQIRDLLQRLDVVADGKHARLLGEQVAALEATAAEQGAQLREEKARFHQQLLTAHHALQEAQCRSLGLGQRQRGMEGEVQELRTALRRAAELQNEAGILKDRHAAEAAAGQREVHRLTGELAAMEEKAAERAQAFEDERQAMARAAAKERHRLTARIESLTEVVDGLTAAVGEGQDRYTDLQCSLQRQVHRAREEAAAEVMALQASLQRAREEAQRAHLQLQRAEEAQGRSRGAAQLRQTAQDALIEENQTLEAKLAAAAQQEAWLVAEKTYAAEQLAAAEQRLDSLAAVVKKCEELEFDAEKMRLRIEVQEEELVECHRDAQTLQAKLVEVKEAAEKRILSLVREVKAYKKKVLKEQKTSNSLRRKLIRAVAEVETGLRHREYPTRPRPNNVGEGEAIQPNPKPLCDVIELLKNQNEQAELLHHRLVELSR